MKIIAGLGNPGKQYEGTRHNAGFEVIDELADRCRISVTSREHRALVGKGFIGGEKVILVKPQTFMNLSGEAIGEIASYYQVPAEDVLVICDDINLPVGSLRIRRKGSAGGHNGLKNIIARLGSEDFPRIRVGVGEKDDRMDLVDHVLGHFAGADRMAMAEAYQTAAKAAELVVTDGIGEAMNRYNVRHIGSKKTDGEEA